MNLRDLQIFCAVCDAGTLTQAARSLQIPQPSLSRTIRGIERDVSQPLFRRTGRGVELTAAGALMRERARRILREWADLQAELGALQGGTSGDLTVLLPHYVSRILVPPLVRRFTTIFPGATIHVFEEAAGSIPERLGARTADLGVFYGSQRGVGLAPQTIAREDMYLVGRFDRLGLRPDAITFAEMARLPLILPSASTPFRRLVETMATAAGHRLTVVRELEVSYTALEFVRDGEGAAVLPLSHCYDEIAAASLVARRIAAPAISRDILLANGPGPATPLVLKAVALIRSVVSEHGPVIGWLSPDPAT